MVVQDSQPDWVQTEEGRPQTQSWLLGDREGFGMGKPLTSLSCN